MKNSKAEKPFDAVKMMRDIRDKISAETQNMTFEQLKQYVEEKTKKHGVQMVKQK